MYFEIEKFEQIYKTEVEIAENILKKYTNDKCTLKKNMETMNNAVEYITSNIFVARNCKVYIKDYSKVNNCVQWNKMSYTEFIDCYGSVFKNKFDFDFKELFKPLYEVDKTKKNSGMIDTKSKIIYSLATEKQKQKEEKKPVKKVIVKPTETDSDSDSETECDSDAESEPKSKIEKKYAKNNDDFETDEETENYTFWKRK